jgi:hypothetical protein
MPDFVNGGLVNGGLVHREMRGPIRATSALAPVNTARPAITGTPDIGETLTVSTGTWSNTPTSYTYQWKRDGSAIVGETANTYVIESVAGGLSCEVTAINTAGSAVARATTGVARQLFLCGDSLTSPIAYTTAVQDALDDAFGAGQWAVTNAAHSGHTVADMEALAASTVDPFVNEGHGVVFFHEYANQVTGMQGPSSGAATAALLFDFGEARAAAGGLPLYCTSPYVGIIGPYDGTQAHIASELVRAGYASHGGVGLVEFNTPTLLADIDANDNLHWTSAVFPEVSAATVTAIVAAGLLGDAGDIEIQPPDFTHLKTYDPNPIYLYDPVNPLPLPVVHTQIQVTSGTGAWNFGTFDIIGGFLFTTEDGSLPIYNVAVHASGGAPAQTNSDLTDGVYVLIP